MKVFKKVFAFAIALTAIAMASSVMAADVTYSDATVTVTNTDIASGSAQTTVAVVPTNLGVTDVADIYYINQGTADEIIADLADGLGLKSAPQVPANYQVRVGSASYATPKVYTIPNYVPVINTPGAPVEEEGNAGFYRYGLDGSVKVNAQTLNNLVFTLKAVGDGVDLTKTHSVAFSGNINSIANNTVTFGLEVANVPANVTVTLSSVEAN